MKYNVGDKVKIREDLKVGERYGMCKAFEVMKPYFGKELTISSSSANGQNYSVKENQDLWSSEMIEGLVRKHMTAEEILHWLAKSDKYKDIFDEPDIDSVLENHPPCEIVGVIEEYEARTPIELEWYSVCRIIKVDGENRKCVYEEEITVAPFETDEKVQDILRAYIAEHDGEYFATIAHNCRQKK